jgi:methyltransferase (TIGR00027 family)
MLELAHTPTFELDLPDVQDTKRRGIERRLGSLPTSVRLVPIDFEREPIDGVLARAGLPANAPSIFIWEGVTQYLRPDAVDAILAAVAGRPRGTALIFTYVLKSAVRSQPRLWHFGLEPSDVNSFLAERGLLLSTDCGAEDHVARYVHPRGRDLCVSDIERVVTARV